MQGDREVAACLARRDDDPVDDLPDGIGGFECIVWVGERLCQALDPAAVDICNVSPLAQG
jgi:hypothetical protein